MMFRTESATVAATNVDTASAAHASTAVRLSPGEMLHWQPRSALRVLVLSGRAWITWAGEPDDHFLDPGGAIDLPAGCSAWVGAETALSLVTVCAPGTLKPTAPVRLRAGRATWSSLRQALTAVRQRLSGVPIHHLYGVPAQRRGKPIATP